MIKRVLLTAMLVIVLGGAGFFFINILLFDRSISKTYDIPLPDVIASFDPSVITRGKHLAESLGKCMQCHGDNLGSGEVVEHGPLGVSKGANLTAGKNGVGYTDAELVRLIKHGVKRNGRSVMYMPSNEMSWWPMEDVVAVISYLRTLPPVDGEPGYVEFGMLAKFLDRMNLVDLDIARRIDHEVDDITPPRAATPEYGAYIAKLCVRCHGKQFSGGPLAGAPPDMVVPSNLTPHQSGLADWTYEDFDKLLTQGIRKDGEPLDPFMSLGAMGKLDELEKRALWAYLRTLPPREFGGH